VIAMVRGILLEKGPESAVVEAGGLGYEVFLPGPALAALPQAGQEVSLYTHFHVREDAQVLYGFLTPADRRVFLLLLTVKGVGPKVALGILSRLSGAVLAAALLKRDLAVLTQVPGVGKKLAERLGVELSDKVSGLDLAVGPADGGGRAEGPWDQAVAALLALGYPQSQARQAVDAAFRGLGKQPAKLEDIVKAALKAV
jgi:Holliday junction DNA helicase RuvA